MRGIQKIFMSLGLALCALVVFAPLSYANLLSNPGFENGVNGWTIGGAGWQTQSNVVYSGTLAARNNIPSLVYQGHYGTMSQTFSITPGVTVYGKVWAKSDIDPLSTANAGLQISFLDSNGQTISYYQDSIGGTTNWRELYVSHVAPTGAVQVVFQCYVFALQGDYLAENCDIYFDDAEFDTTYIAPPTHPFGLYNPGFENGLHDWWINGPNWVIEQNNPYAGNYSSKNTIGIIANQDYFADLAQDEPITANQTVYATAWAQTNIDIASSAQAGIIVDFLDSTKTPIPNTEVQDTIGGVTTWTQLYVTATAPSNAAYVRYRTFIFANQNDALAIGGVGYFDECVLSDQYIAPPGGSQLANPGFENGLNGWSIVEPNLTVGTGATWGLEQANPFAGSISARNNINMNDLVSGYDYYATVNQEFNTTPGITYYATLQVKTGIHPSSLAQAGLLVEFLDVNNNVLASDQDAIGGTFGWKMMYVATTAPTGTVKVRYSCFVSAQENDLSAHNGFALFDEAVLTTTYIAPPGNSQLENADFENGLNQWDILEPYLNSGNSNTWMLEQTFPYSGYFSSLNEINMDLVTGQEYYATVSQTISATANTTYYATLMAQTDIDPLSMAKAGLLIEFLDNTGTVIGDEKDVIGGNTTWRLLYVVITAPANTAEIRYSCFVSAKENDMLADQGLAYFDEAILTTTYIAPPSPQTTLMNPDYENGLHDWEVIEPYLVAGSDTTWEAQTSQVHGGAIAAYNEIDQNLVSGQNYYAALHQELEAVAGDPVHATAWVKTNFNYNSSAVAGIKLAFLDSSGVEITSLQNTLNGIHGWTQLTLNVVAPQDTETVVYSVFVFANNNDPLADGGDAYFDDVTLDFVYVNHLGMLNGSDIFPQETSQQTYYSGAASTRAAIRYLLGTSPTQSTIYNTYHWSGAGNDMLSGEIMTALNGEVGSPYNFTDWYQTTNQLDAMKNFVYWIDWLPPGGIYCPAQVPVNGNLNWRTVRGIVTDMKPHPIGLPMPNFTIEGLWINDPAVSGLGYNIYQIPAAFQSDYLPLASTGTYRAVYEPPVNLNQKTFAQTLHNTPVYLAAPEPSVDLRDEIIATRAKSMPLINISFEFNLEYLESALPSILFADPVFGTLFNKMQYVKTLEVNWLDQGDTYTILALGKGEDSQNPNPIYEEEIEMNYTEKSTSALPAAVALPVPIDDRWANILVEANPDNGACMQESWVKTAEIYPRVDEAQAIALAQKKISTMRNVATQTPEGIRWVWSKNFKTSRFHPSYEVMYRDMTVWVHPDGRVEVKTAVPIYEQKTAISTR